MDAMTSAPAEGKAVRFTGDWREFLPIALTNLLLTIVTLGIYRFWATARQRRYLWSRTELIGERLEWTGTGKEMFIGFLIVMAILIPVLLFFQFGFMALVLRGKFMAALGTLMLIYIGLIFLGGFAQFRALRYRLSRTLWRGIRGGSDDPGWNYGGEYLGRALLSAMTLSIIFPWMTTRLWISRWNKMSFGPLSFRSDMTAEGLKARWAALYGAIAFIMIAFFAMIGSMAASAQAGTSPEMPPVFAVFIFAFYIAIPLLTLHWFAKFFRLAADHTKLGDLEFSFTARTRDWLGLFFGNLGLAIITFGVGALFWGYRNWAFVIRHLDMHGEINVSRLTQSTTRAPGEAEGLADAFDIGAI